MEDPIAVIYQQVASDEPFYRLVDEFYAAVESDTLLRPLYPKDLRLSKEHLVLFLIQRTGGRTTYSDRRGHPRMRARHMPFPIGIAERDAWLRHMDAALEKVQELQPHKEVLRIYFADFATFLMNQPT